MTKGIISMKRIATSIDVHVPVGRAYNQWTQFEEYSRFMRHVVSVEQLDDRNLRWRVRVGGKVMEWDAVIVEQIPCKRIVWRTTDGGRHSGVVTFQALSGDICRINLELEYEFAGLVEKLGGLLGSPRSEIEDDMRSFANFIEAREAETGAWYGRILRKEPGDQDPGQ